MAHLKRLKLHPNQRETNWEGFQIIFCGHTFAIINLRFGLPKISKDIYYLKKHSVHFETDRKLIKRRFIALLPDLETEVWRVQNRSFRRMPDLEMDPGNLFCQTGFQDLI